jgi:dephospho-CoA kinase
MVVLGLTGGIGTGKSVAGEILTQAGAVVIDTDTIARELTLPGTPELLEIAATFGPEVLSNEGLNRQRLAEIVFADPGARQKLEAILHPTIRSIWRARVAALKEQVNVSMAIVVIPLLFETAAEREVDQTVCVACTRGTQLERLRARGWSDAHIELRLAAQLPMRAKMERADYVIWNEFDLATCQAQLERVVGLVA